MDNPATESERANILLVDDQPDNLLALEVILEGLGQNLVMASSGREALRHLLEKDFAVILLDVQMPEMDGLETAVMIRQRERSRNSPIIFLTAAFRDVEHTVQAYATGAVDYVFKPISPEILRAKVSVFVELHKKTEQLRQLAESKARMAQMLAERNAQLERASKFKDQFLSTMSHELRTPLNAIIGFAELMMDGKVGPVSERHAEYLGDILTSGRHLLQLINDVLDLSKVESGKMEFRPEPVDPARLVAEVCDILRALAANKRIEIAARINPRLGLVVIDPAKTKQVLYNFLSNALKFTPEEGGVTVRMRPTGEEFFRLEVEDTGIGIQEGDIPKLFREFQQLDAGAAKKYPGTGLGLALTKRIVESQGGWVGVHSAAGKGSVFFAVLPRLAKVGIPAEAESEGAGFLPPHGSGPSILIIEDDSEDRAWLVRTLSEGGYAVMAVENGAEAVAACRERVFDAITLDLLLPDMGGWDVLRAIRAEGENRNTPVIAVTVVAEEGAAVGFQVQDFLVKPVQAEQLLASLLRAGVSPGGSRKVLVVDDDPQARKLMEATLKHAGYRPICKKDAKSGLQVAEQEHPAAVILDLLMPEMDGFGFLERFRKKSFGRDTPVIVWTVKELTAEDHARLRSTAQGIVPKGQNGAAGLLRTLEDILAGGSVSSAVEDNRK